MEEFNVILEIIEIDNESNESNEEKINFSIIRNIEINQDNIQCKITRPNDQIEPPENLSLHESVRLNSNDRNISIELVRPFIGKKRFRKTFRFAKRK